MVGFTKMKKTNYHTHSTFCDGKNTPEQIVQIALQKGFDALGFSSHSMYPFSSDWHLQSREHSAYAKEIHRLSKEYSDRIQVKLGFEADFIEGVCAPKMDRFAEFDPDYLIGAVHYVPGKKGFIEADGREADVLEGIKNYFDGDAKKAVQEYFYLERQMLKTCDFTIIAHCDLIKKQNGPKVAAPLFDEKSEWYKKEIALLADEIASAGVVAEVNVGGMARGYMATSFPHGELLSLLIQKNVPLTLSSDSHSAETLDFAFDETIQMLKNAGCKELAFMEGKNSFKMQPL